MPRSDSPEAAWPVAWLGYGELSAAMDRLFAGAEDRPLPLQEMFAELRAAALHRIIESPQSLPDAPNLSRSEMSIGQ